jgi:2-polyprenyl-3-methyl-5-hydroxy-6-metoxy-1,4-benzoquinol methylase
MDSRLQHEIDHGKYLIEHGAGEVWNWEGPAGRLRWARRVEMLTSHIRPGMKVLELGCGTGYFTKSLALTGADVTAIDISPDLLEAARAGCKAANIRFVIENAYAMSFGADIFDTVVGSSVLHHLDVAQALSELHRVLKPGGTLFFTEPNMMNPQIALQKNIPAIKRRMGDSPDETAFFRWSLGRKLKAAGFANIKIDCFDFLHPKVPAALIPLVSGVGMLCEKLPLVSEIAGSLYIRAEK